MVTITMIIKNYNDDYHHHHHHHHDYDINNNNNNNNNNGINFHYRCDKKKNISTALFIFEEI